MSDTQPSKAATYRNIFLFFLALAIVVWVAPLPGDWMLPFRIAMPFAVVGFGIAWLVNLGAARERAPDLLAEQVGTYFERDGLCFAPTLSVSDGLCWFNVFVQNRYSRPCQGTIYFFPMEGMSRPGAGQHDLPHDVPPMIASVDCDGGQVAVMSFPYPVAAKWQDRIMIYDVFATSQYPGGRGELLRPREGTPVGAPTSGDPDMAKAAGFLAFGLVGVAAVRMAQGPGSGSCELRLPDCVAEREPPGVAPKTEVLWVLDLPTGGFPVS
jgi:hypothetical protein